MSFFRALHPAIIILNKLTFKYKIILLISILMSLLILPSITYVLSYSQKSVLFEKQETALLNVKQIHKLITQIQVHRGMTNGYLYGKKSFNEKILQIEPLMMENIDRYITENEETLKSVHVFKKLKDIRMQVKNLLLKEVERKDLYPAQLFLQHEQVINELILLLQKVSDYYKFGVSENLTIQYLAGNMTNKLLLLQENTAVLRGLATGLLSQNYISMDDKNKLLFIYNHISATQKEQLNSETNKYLTKIADIAKQGALLQYRVNSILYIVRQNILLQSRPNFSPEKFFKLATDTIETQNELYNLFLKKYDQILQREKEQHKYNTFILLIGFTLIFAIVSYLALAFYYSVTRSIKKLQNVSEMIAKGDTDIALISDTEDEVHDALAAFQDVGNRLGENISFLNSYKTAIDESSVVSKTDKRGIITYVNDKFCEISQYSKEELVGKSHNIIRHPDMPKELFKEMWKTLKSGNIWHNIIKNRKKNGESYIVDSMVMPIFDAKGEIVEYIAIRHDITELIKSRKKVQEEMKKQKIDPLTKLPNKIQLTEDLKTVKAPVLFYLNINDFADLNDFYGTKIGDKVLCNVASLLDNTFSDKNLKLYKLSSDAFVFLASDEEMTTRPEALISEIVDYIEYETSLCKDKDCIGVTMSGGIATHKEAGYDQLISYATMARKVAKKENKSFLRYSLALNKNVDYEKNIAWINKIKEALLEDRITTFYQPIVDNKTGEYTKYETLVRLVEKGGKVISPFFFLDIAKKARLYTQITKVVFDKAFTQFKDQPNLEFSINISIEDIEDSEITTYIYDKLRSFPYPNNVILEITEDQEIKNYEKINGFIKKAKALGAKIAIDDFGSGYANFDHIIKLNADFIKIDGSLIKNIDIDEESLIITQAIIAFSKKLGSQTVVEFVHNERIDKIVKELGADYSQGYYLGEPLPHLVNQEDMVEVM